MEFVVQFMKPPCLFPIKVSISAEVWGSIHRAVFSPHPIYQALISSSIVLTADKEAK